MLGVRKSLLGRKGLKSRWEGRAPGEVCPAGQETRDPRSPRRPWPDHMQGSELPRAWRKRTGVWVMDLVGGRELKEFTLFLRVWVPAKMAVGMWRGCKAWG